MDPIFTCKLTLCLILLISFKGYFTLIVIVGIDNARPFSFSCLKHSLQYAGFNKSNIIPKEEQKIIGLDPSDYFIKSFSCR